MNISEIEARQTWLVERFDAELPDFVMVGTGPMPPLDLTHWSCDLDCVCCQPPF